jgi:hypothetical protein
MRKWLLRACFFPVTIIIRRNHDIPGALLQPYKVNQSEHHAGQLRKHAPDGRLLVLDASPAREFSLTMGTAVSVVRPSYLYILSRFKSTQIHFSNFLPFSVASESLQKAPLQCESVKDFEERIVAHPSSSLRPISKYSELRTFFYILHEMKGNTSELMTSMYLYIMRFMPKNGIFDADIATWLIIKYCQELPVSVLIIILTQFLSLIEQEISAIRNPLALEALASLLPFKSCLTLPNNASIHPAADVLRDFNPLNSSDVLKDILHRILLLRIPLTPLFWSTIFVRMSSWASLKVNIVVLFKYTEALLASYNQLVAPQFSLNERCYVALLHYLLLRKQITAASALSEEIQQKNNIENLGFLFYAETLVIMVELGQIARIPSFIEAISARLGHAIVLYETAIVHLLKKEEFAIAYKIFERMLSVFDLWGTPDGIDILRLLLNSLHHCNISSLDYFVKNIVPFLSLIVEGSQSCGVPSTQNTPSNAVFDKTSVSRLLPMEPSLCIRMLRLYVDRCPSMLGHVFDALCDMPSSFLARLEWFNILLHWFMGHSQQPKVSAIFQKITLQCLAKVERRDIPAQPTEQVSSMFDVLVAPLVVNT